MGERRGRGQPRINPSQKKQTKKKERNKQKRKKERKKEKEREKSSEVKPGSEGGKRDRKEAASTGNSLAIVEDGLGDFDGEAGGAVEAVVGGVSGRTRVRLERDVGSHRRRGARRRRRRPGLRRRSTRTSLCNHKNRASFSRHFRVIFASLDVTGRHFDAILTSFINEFTH